MALKRMGNVAIVVDDLGGTTDFFRGQKLAIQKSVGTHEPFDPVQAGHRVRP